MGTPCEVNIQLILCSRKQNDHYICMYMAVIYIHTDEEIGMDAAQGPETVGFVSDNLLLHVWHYLVIKFIVYVIVNSKIPFSVSQSTACALL